MTGNRSCFYEKSLTGKDFRVVVKKNKESIRNGLRNVRAAMDVDEWRSGSLLIAEKLFQIPVFRYAGSVMLYLSMNDRHEVDTGPLISLISAEGRIGISVPVVSGDSLCAVRYSEGEPVAPGKFGQPEPANVKPVLRKAPDIIVVPAVAVDPEGRRLGYGKGYYDRFISELRRDGANPFVIAPVFSFQVLDLLPHDPWDEKLDCIVTEKEVVNITNRENRFHNGPE